MHAFPEWENAMSYPKPFADVVLGAEDMLHRSAPGPLLVVAAHPDTTTWAPDLRVLLLSAELRFELLVFRVRTVHVRKTVAELTRDDLVSMGYTDPDAVLAEIARRKLRPDTPLLGATTEVLPEDNE